MTKYKLYPSISNRSNWINKSEIKTRNIINLLSWCDGENSLDDISHKIKCSKSNIEKIFKILLKKKLITL